MTKELFSIPVVFAINNNFVKQLATAILSILDHSDAKTFYDFYVLSADLSAQNKKNLERLQGFGSRFCLHFVDMQKIIQHAHLERYMSARENYTYITIETYFRFFIPQILKQYDKILYLDSDILVFQDLQNLYQTDISQYYAGVVRDPFFEICLQNKNFLTRTSPHLDMKNYARLRLKKKNFLYFNAGVLLLNLKKMRKDHVAQKLWAFTYENSPLEFQDQDALNAVLEDRVLWLDEKWNVLKEKSFYVKDKKIFKPFGLMKTYKKPAVFHFTGPDKPWRVTDDSRYGYAFLEKWWHYYQLTPPPDISA